MSPSFRRFSPRRAVAVLGIGALPLLGSACTHPSTTAIPPGHVTVKRGGPPPWAPAHGYRHKHRSGVELVFDVGLDVYVVLGHPRHYFHDGRFFKRLDGGWAWAQKWDGRWKPADASEVPRGLLAAGKSHGGRGHAGRRRGPGPASHGR